MKSPFHHIRHAHKTFEHFHKNLHHAFVIFTLAIIGMLWWASHILTPSTANRQWWGFITSDFWEQHPSNANIIYALFGDGTPGATAYTRTRSSSCIPTSVQYVPSNFSGWLGDSNTIYILNSGSYTLTSIMWFTSKSCSAIIGIGDVTIKTSLTSNIFISWSNNIILDNIHINGQWIGNVGLKIHSTTNITLNNMDWYWYLPSSISWYAVQSNNSHHLSISNSRFYNNDIWVFYSYWNNTHIGAVINNSHFYNNNLGLILGWVLFGWSINTVNNSQFYNNTIWLIWVIATITSNNNIFYNNSVWSNPLITHIYSNNDTFYNNTTWINWSNALFEVYGTLKLFNNTTGYSFDSWSSGVILGSILPIPSWSYGSIDTWSTAVWYDRFTNPQNSSGQRLLNGTNRSSLRWTQTFDPTKTPIRYIFGLNIPKQITPVWYNGSILDQYGSNNFDYFTTRYIAEPDSTLSADDQTLVNQYFGSWSIYTQNRVTNGCSLSAFQVVHLDPQNFSTTYYFQDHTLYILTGGQYRSDVAATNGFVFSGNCIALIGNKHTKFTKSSAVMTNLFYAKDKHNIILDTLNLDWLYFNTNSYSPAVNSAIFFDGTTNNTTINNVQIANTTKYGIFMGLGSHHTTIMNSQMFNNGTAGMYLYYASNYNVINNTQTYNNGLYGIRFANWSSKNTMNNFQSYNNTIGVYGDLTTTENIINRAAIYNNSDAWIYFKNSSNNSLNDVRLYNNNIGIRTLYNSPGNKYYGELVFSNNYVGNFDGTNGNDSSLSAGNAWLFAYAGSISTGTTLAWCIYATNPTLSWVAIHLLNTDCSNTWYNIGFISPYTSNVKYMFGLNMYKQKVPVRYTSGSSSLTQLTSQYDPNKYIAEVLPIWDDQPEGVFFTVSWTIEPNTRYTTNIYTAGVLNISVPVSLSFNPTSTSGNILISGHITGLTGLVNNGDTIQIRLLSASGYHQTITWTIVIWSISTDFTVTTRDISQTPTSWSFAFTNFTSMPVNTFTGSVVTISGIETWIWWSITFVPSTTSGRLEVYSGWTMVSSWTTGLLIYNGNQVKAIGQSSSGFSQTVTGYITLGLWSWTFTITTKWSDTTPPTAPVLTYPLSWEELFFITRERIAATDTWSWIEGYVYEIAEDPNFLDIVNTWFIDTITGTMGSPNTGFNATSDTFYRRMQARDRDGNFSPRSNTGKFEAIDSDEWEFTTKTHANLRTYYDSNEITLEGIKSWISLRASIDENGILYKNGNDKWTGSYIQNWDKLYVTARSSNKYNKSTSTLLTIANRQLTFTITTKSEDEYWCTLSQEDKDAIQSIFDTLITNYSGTEDKYTQFLYTMQSMLADEIDFTNDCNLQYLQNLIQQELGIQQTTISTWTHIAPNCKEYQVTYDPITMTYTSPTLTTITYFANRETLTRYIDSKNPGDCHINTYDISSRVFTNNDPTKHIASNGKIYDIVLEGGKYTSNTFIYKKYFNSIAELRTYIDRNNMPSQVWNHQVDTSFTPQMYIAPNGKEYKIYKTNRGYMSYKLMKVQYFWSLSELQSYISKNNPR